MSTRRRRTKSGSKEDTNSYIESGYGYAVKPTGNTFIENKESSFETLDMSSRDRTVEFLSTVKSLQSRQANGYHMKNKNGYRNSRMIQPSQFTLLSRQIGNDIRNTFNKLEKLAILAKRKSLFDDKPVEIQELTYIIKQILKVSTNTTYESSAKDINNLNQQITNLQQFVNRSDASKNKNTQTHSHTVVMSLQSKLAHMSKDFKHVLEVRTENMKQQKSRREQFSQGAFADSLHAQDVSSNSLLNRHANGGNESHVSLDMEPLMQQNTQMYAQDDEYVQSRASAMENIEQTIVELGGIFQQLAHLVSEQEETIKRIDNNVVDTELNVEAAHSELLKYFQSISSNRWLIVKIFFVLIVFFIVFVVFMV